MDQLIDDTLLAEDDEGSDESDETDSTVASSDDAGEDDEKNLALESREVKGSEFLEESQYEIGRQ